MGMILWLCMDGTDLHFGYPPHRFERKKVIKTVKCRVTLGLSTLHIVYCIDNSLVFCPRDHSLPGIEMEAMI